MQENNAAKWFCEFGLMEATPDPSVLSKIRARIGTGVLAAIFSELRTQLKQQGVMKNQFAAFMQAISFNLKRLVTLDLPNFCLN